jgi:hypothetical protein
LRRAPGDALLHPAALAAIALLLANDHWLKHAHPGVVSGKLSDFAGLAFFPLVLVSAWEQLAAARGPWRPSRAQVTLAVAATALAFTAVKLWAPALDAWRWTLGALQAPLTGRLVAAVAVRDATDLIALPALALPLAIGLARARTCDMEREAPSRYR